MRTKGRGSLTEYRNGWRAQISLGRDPATGKRRRMSAIFTNKEKAEAWLRENRAKTVTSTAVSVGDLFDLWLIHKENEVEAEDLSTSTLSGIGRRLKSTFARPSVIWQRPK